MVEVIHVLARSWNSGNISRMTNNKECTGQIHPHCLRLKDAENILMSFMCAGSHENSFFISTCYYTNFLCVRKTKQNKRLNIRNRFVETVALVHGKRKVTG